MWLQTGETDNTNVVDRVKLGSALPGATLSGYLPDIKGTQRCRSCSKWIHPIHFWSAQGEFARLPTKPSTVALQSASRVP